MEVTNLLSRLKGTLLIPDSVTKFDDTLRTYLLGSKEYVDSILDHVPESNDDLYNLVVIFYAQYNFMNRDNPKLKSFPVSLNALLNRLKDKYSK